MGGSAFSSGPDPLFTPRMPSSVYREVRDRCHAALRKLFLCVATPIDGPAKKDYGDIDILVALEKRLVFPVATAPVQAAPDQVASPGRGDDMLALIREALGAERMIIERGGMAANLAIPWPEDLLAISGSDGDAPVATGTDITMTEDCYVPKQQETQPQRQTESDQQEQQTRHIQVDVRICASVQQLQWALFKHAHGDLWNLVGSTIRPLGLTVDEEALWLRIPEIETFHRSRAKVLLTADPAAVLAFLGMSAEAKYWEEPFGSVEGLFDYVASCRWFWVALERSAAAADGDGQAETTDNGSAEDKKKLKANDRRRMKYRPVYRAWVEEYLPKRRSQRHAGLPNIEAPPAPAQPDPDTAPPIDPTAPPPPTPTDLARLSVRDEALTHFPAAAPIYASRLREWQIERQRDEIWRSVIKGGVPPGANDQKADINGAAGALDPAYRACLVRALRALLIPDPPSLPRSESTPPTLTPTPSSGTCEHPGQEQQGQAQKKKKHDHYRPLALGPAILNAASSVRFPDGTYDVDAAREFVRQHWEEVGRVAWEAQVARAREAGERWLRGKEGGVCDAGAGQGEGEAGGGGKGHSES